MNNAKFAARGGILVAVTLALLYFASLSPFARLGLCAGAGVLPALPLSHRKVWLGFAVYLASMFLAVLFVPSKTTVFLYMVLGGYSFIKYAAEKQRRQAGQWVVKISFASFGYSLFLLLIHAGFVPSMRITGQWMYLIFLFVFLAVFVAYDHAFTRLIGLLYVLFPRD